MHRTLAMLCVILLVSCSPQPNSDKQINQVITDYYQVYKKRTDFDRFLAFYHDDIILEDMITGDRKVGKKAFKEFFDWENENFSLVDSVTMVIENQLIKDMTVVTSGYFTPFKWGEYEFEAMQFTTILTFDDSLKIIKHIDWINYPNNLLNYETRKNSNDWIK